MFTHPSVFFRYMLLSLLLSAGVLTGVAAEAGTVRYVSDQLTIPMRSGPTSQNRIIKFLPSGTMLTVLGTSDDGNYLNIENQAGKQGWVEVKSLMDQPAARQRIVVVNKRLAQAYQAINQLKKNIVGLKQHQQQVDTQYKTLKSKKQSLQGKYDDLRVTASSSIILSRSNKQLQTELDQAQASESAMEKENQRLRDNVMQNWFLIGAGVSLGSLILGLLLTRINWKSKRNSWGDSF